MERGIAPIVIAMNQIGVKTVSSCEGHTDAAYITTIPLPERDLRALKDLLQQALASFSLEDILVRTQQVDMPADAPYQGRTILWLDNYQKLLPADKERVAKKVAGFLNRTISPR